MGGAGSRCGVLFFFGVSPPSAVFEAVINHVESFVALSPVAAFLLQAIPQRLSRDGKSASLSLPFPPTPPSHTHTLSLISSLPIPNSTKKERQGRGSGVVRDPSPQASQGGAACMERDRTRRPPEESEHRWPSPAFDPVQWRLRGAVERGGDLTLRMISRFCSSVVAMEISFRIVPEGPHFSALVASRTLASMSDRFSTTLFLWGMPWERGISL